MDEAEARLLLQSYRADGSDENDPQFAAALEKAARNPALGEWFAEEQAFDRTMAAHLENVPAPFGLKTRFSRKQKRRDRQACVGGASHSPVWLR